MGSSVGQDWNYRCWISVGLEEWLHSLSRYMIFLKEERINVKWENWKIGIFILESLFIAIELYYVLLFSKFLNI